MPPIIKSKGTTLSERQLAHLADFSFLSLWAYPNVFRGRGKELCDVLIVCGNNVIVFSDKSITWPANVPTEVAWGRWYRKAIGHSAQQLRRALHWIREHPDRIFLDAACKHPFPIQVPHGETLNLHGVIVARGAAEACRSHFNGGSGSLAVSPMDCSTPEKGQVPETAFFIGNPCPGGDDVYHVIDDVTLPILLLELDTVSDFVRYLNKRKVLIKAGHLLFAEGEEDVLALYLKDVGPDGDHDFVSSKGKPLEENDKIWIEGGTYNILRTRGEYLRKKSADQVSYFWDYLIEQFAKNIIADTTYTVRGYDGVHSASQRELGLRYMALVHRLERRSHSLAIRGAFEKIGNKDRFFRAMLPLPGQGEETGFFILLVKRQGFLSNVGDDDYRLYRASVMQAYALNVLRSRRDLVRVVGIATEGEIEGDLRSEDMIYAEQPEWTAEYEAEVIELAKTHNIMKGGSLDSLTFQHIRPLEYPPSHHRQIRGRNPIPYEFNVPPESGNRASRRAAAARRRKRK